MPGQVATGATLQCSFGAAPSTFAASSTDVAATAGAGVVTDVSPGNVPPFGLCSSPANPAVAAALSPQPCVPLLSPWTPGSARVTVGEIAALDDSSQCACAWGGVVTVSSPGQGSVALE
jgi:hypothetical protein